VALARSNRLDFGGEWRSDLNHPGSLIQIRMQVQKFLLSSVADKSLSVTFLVFFAVTYLNFVQI